jgi:hypothetical protein
MARKGSRLSALDRNAKLVYTLFAVFALGHLTSGAALYWERTVRRAEAGHIEEVRDYYRGRDSRMMYPKTLSQILEITHQHLFAMPLTLLVVAHLFILSRMAGALTWPIIGTTAASMAGHIAAPWLVRFHGPGWAWLFPVTGVTMLALIALMFGASLWDMWIPRAPGARNATT